MSSAPVKPSLSDGQALLERIRNGPYRLSLSDHALKRGRQGRNFDVQDIENVVQRGRVTKVEWHATSKQWTYRIAGTDRDGDELTVIVAFDQARSSVRVVTGF